MRAIAGVSGGRTSAYMALRCCPPDTVFSFQNTGREHPQTLEFLRRVEDALRSPIVRLEWRAPARGEPPRNASFEEVRHENLSVHGEPFRDLLECLAAYRAKHKNKPPISPWARQRICTAYLKIKTVRMYTKALGWEDFVSYVGLRADEPERVARMKERNDRLDTDERAPLFDLGISKGDVLAFWRNMPFDLELPEYLGNCTACFLKDERDLASALSHSITEADWWIESEQRFGPMRRGRTSYADVLRESPERFKIRAQIARGVAEPVSNLPAKRHKLIVIQERQAPSSFSCACEGAVRLADEEIE